MSSSLRRASLLAPGAAVLVVGGCAHLRARGEPAYEAVVAVSPDSTLRLARARLEGLDYVVREAGPNAIVTLPVPIPPRLVDGDRRLEGRSWMLHVSAEPQRLTSGTRLHVTGYVLPLATTDGGATRRDTSPVTADQRALFAEVRAAGHWIEAATTRKGA